MGDALIYERIIAKINSYYTEEKRLILMVLMQQQCEEGNRTRRLLKLTMNDEQGFRDACDQAYEACHVSLEHALNNPLQEMEPRSASAIDTIVREIDHMVNNSYWRTCLYAADAAAGANFVLLPLVFAIQTIIFVRRWWKNELRGDEAACEIGIATFNAALTAVGLAFGTKIGATSGELEASMGGVIGVVIGTIAAHVLTLLLRKKMIDGSKQRTLSMAYAYFCLDPNCSNGDVDAAYKRQCLQVHPDRRGGSTAKQVECDTYFSIIRAARSGSTTRQKVEVTNC